LSAPPVGHPVPFDLAVVVAGELGHVRALIGVPKIPLPNSLEFQPKEAA
jgi:hypothetical protein